MKEKYYIKYKDLDDKWCDTIKTNRKFRSIDEFISHCKDYGIKWEYFKEIELIEHG